MSKRIKNDFLLKITKENDMLFKTIMMHKNDMSNRWVILWKKMMVISYKKWFVVKQKEWKENVNKNEERKRKRRLIIIKRDEEGERK